MSTASIMEVDNINASTWASRIKGSGRGTYRGMRNEIIYLKPRPNASLYETAFGK